MTTWVYSRDGRVFRKDSPEYAAYLSERAANAPMIAKDEGEFVSPIDGQIYSGRAGMREHNKRHDVVNWRDCQGLPTEMPKEPPQGVREAVIEAAKRNGYLNGQ